MSELLSKSQNMWNERIIQEVIASSRIEGIETSKQSEDALRKYVFGEISADEYIKLCFSGDVT